MSDFKSSTVVKDDGINSEFKVFVNDFKVGLDVLTEIFEQNKFEVIEIDATPFAGQYHTRKATVTLKTVNSYGRIMRGWIKEQNSTLIYDRHNKNRFFVYNFLEKEARVMRIKDRKT